MQMPPAARFVSNQAGFDLWRQPTRFAEESLFDAAHALGLTTALIGQADFHDLHVDGAQIDVRVPAAAAATSAALRLARSVFAPVRGGGAGSGTASGAPRRGGDRESDRGRAGCSRRGGSRGRRRCAGGPDQPRGDADRRSRR
jgi:hypothetical protein